MVETQPNTQEKDLAAGHRAKGRTTARTHRHLRFALAAWLFSAPCCAETPNGSLTDQSESEKLLLDRLIVAESGGWVFAKNPRSSALGPFQFVQGTFLELMRRKQPALTSGKSNAEISRLRVDPKISRDAALIYIRETAQLFTSHNVAATPTNLRLAFFLGQAGALRVVAAKSDKPVSSIVGSSTLAANPWLKGLTAGQLISWSNRQVEGVAIEEASPEPSAERRDAAAAQPVEQPSPSIATVAAIASTSQDQVPELPMAEETKAIAAAPANPQLVPVIAARLSEKDANPPGNAPFPEQAAGTGIHVACNLKLASCRKWLALAEKRLQLAEAAVHNQ